MIIDCHAHVGRGEALYDVFQIDCTPERLLHLMEKGGVGRCVIFPVSYKDYTKPNEEIAELVAQNGRFIGFGRINGCAPDAGIKAEYAIKELGLRGIKLHATDGSPTRECMDAIAKLDVPVLAHSGMGLSPLVYEGIVNSYPEITFILAHLGIGTDWSDYFSSPLTAFYMARKYRNVYLDTAAAHWIQYVIEQAVAEAGPDKILFGSDAPWFYPSIMRACIEDLEIPDSDKAKIMGGNIARILNL